MSQLSIVIKQGEFRRDRDFISKMDPYVVVNVGGRVYKTSVQREAGKHPVWNERFVFPYQPGYSDMVSFTAYDWDTASQDDKLGHATVSLATLLVHGRFDGWIELQGTGVLGALGLKRYGRINVTISVEQPPMMTGGYPMQPQPYAQPYAQPYPQQPYGQPAGHYPPPTQPAYGAAPTYHPHVSMPVPGYSGYPPPTAPHAAGGYMAPLHPRTSYPPPAAGGAYYGW
eukprot:GILK01014181.1.p1 GENE.GILK01014181.1~~GILK01014181.1.p1  ORF type:complete len:227 (-),score=10.17 GILK01014181.1:82-762(-)